MASWWLLLGLVLVSLPVAVLNDLALRDTARLCALAEAALRRAEESP